jgi:hypothetical protein
VAVTAEARRLEEDRTRQKYWKRWGPYLSERAWGTVREDYSAYGTAWDYFPHDHARSRAYRWNEDGLAGISDRHQRICFALALWNEQDPILKERLFGLTGSEGNHGEDVKEHYFYLDSTPTHSYMRWLYKYPQRAFPYAELVDENRRRGREAPEFELLDTGVFDGDRYFDVFAEYAKGDPDDLAIRVTVYNRGPEAARLHVLPTVWFRNTWSWDDAVPKPMLHRAPSTAGASVVALDEPRYGRRYLYCDGGPDILVTENETNTQRLYGNDRPGPFKDGINDAVVNGLTDALSADQTGTKAAAHYVCEIAAGGAVTFRLRLTDRAAAAFNEGPFGLEFDRLFEVRRGEADEFYATIIPDTLSADAQLVMRQSFAGVLWSKQFYHFVIRDWLGGDPAQPPPPSDRATGRNHEWPHLYNADVISMPDKWEYPWYAAWDLAFHCVPLALVDADFREGATRADAARVVHASQRTASGLRVGVWRRQPAGPRLGGLARLQDREEADGPRRSRLSRARLPEAAAELHVVGQSQGRRGAQRLSGRLPRASTTSACSTARRRCRPGGISNSPTAPAGWRCTASTCSPSRWSWPTATGLRRRGQQVLGALPLYRACHEHGRWRWQLVVGRRRRVLLRRAAPARRHAPSAEGAFHGRADSALCRGDDRARGAEQTARLQTQARVVHRESGRPHQ